MPVSSLIWTRAVTPCCAATADTVWAASKEPTVRMTFRASSADTSSGRAVEESISTSAVMPASRRAAASAAEDTASMSTPCAVSHWA